MKSSQKSAKPVKILIVDDHALIRRGIMALLKNHDPEWQLHEAEDGVRAVIMVQEVDPDIVLLDYHMPKMNGAKTAAIISRVSPRAKIIIVSMDASPEMVFDIIQSGVAGVVSKQSGEDELIRAIDNVKSGKQHLANDASEIAETTSRVKEKPDRRYKHSQDEMLTDREIEVLKYIVQGYSSPSIAKALALSTRTVSNHKLSMYKKCKVNSSLELVRFAVRRKIIPK